MWYSNLGKNSYFSSITSTNIDTLVPSLYQCVETRSIEVSWLLSQPLPYPVGHHLRFSNVLESISPPSCEPLYAINTSHRKHEIFLYEYPFHWIFVPQRKAQQNPVLRQYIPQARSPFWLLKLACEHEHVRLLPRLWWSWTVLLPSDTQTTYCVHYSCFTSVCGLFTDSPS
jgi:hypothetical protein